LGDGGFKDSGQDLALRARGQAWQIPATGQAGRQAGRGQDLCARLRGGDWDGGQKQKNQCAKAQAAGLKGNLRFGEIQHELHPKILLIFS
jgi:hypothetical protein